MPRTPALTVSLRGNTRFTLRVRTLEHASHSGMFGGAVPDAMMATVKLLATLWDEDGAVAVEGLDGTGCRDPRRTARRRSATRRACLPGVSPIGRGTILSRIWNKPSITVTGIDAPERRERVQHAEPRDRRRDQRTRRPGSAGARGVCRDRGAPARARAVRSAARPSAIRTTATPFLVDTSGWAVETALEAMHEAYGVEPVEIGVGGSIPFIADLVREFPGAQILVTGVEDPHARAHSPNESLHLETFRNAVLAEALLLEKLDARTARLTGTPPLGAASRRRA